MIKVGTVRNVLTCAGTYYISKWVALGVALGWGKVTAGLIYTGTFEGTLVAPLVIHVPIAIAAAGAGVVVACLIESNRPLMWLFLLALFYACMNLLGYRWARPVSFGDRVFQAAGAVFPAVTCIVGGMLMLRRRAS